MLAQTLLHKAISFLVAIGMVITPIAPTQISSPAQSQLADQSAQIAKTEPNPGVLFRTRITVEQSTDWARLKEMGVVFLSQGEADALVLADFDQLERLARLGFQPTDTDEFETLVTANAERTPWLARSLTPVLERSVQAQSKLRTLGSISDEQKPETAEAVKSLREAMVALTSEQTAALADLTSLDDDADGLTNAQEAWWCTDPFNADSDGDGTSDGAEVQAAKDWLGNRRAGPPSTGRPFAGWPPATFDATKPPTCRDGDNDGVPDMAERWDLGLNMNAESTDRDKFDDGQELFGTTEWGRGALPRVTDDAGYIFAEMPTWVKAPGNHPFVAAFPVPEIDVVASSLKVETVTTVTTDHVISSGTEKSYSTAKTEGTSTSVADTETWNSWQESTVSTSVPLVNRQVSLPRKTNGSYLENLIKGELKSNVAAQNCVSGSAAGAVGVGVGLAGGGAAGASSNAGCMNVNVGQLDASFQAVKEVTFDKLVDLRNNSVRFLNDIQTNIKVNFKNSGCIGLINIGCGEGATANLSNDQKAEVAVQFGTGQDRSSMGDQSRYVVYPNANSNQQGDLAVRQYYQLSMPLRMTPTVTNSSTKGTSVGGARTTTHGTYEEHTVTNGEAFSNGESWGNATAADSAHTADLWFTYKVRNTGTEYARQIGNLAFNLYIGDDPDPAYTYFVASDIGGNGLFENFMPNEEHTYTSRRIPLSLEQMKAIDLGGPLRVVVEDFTYGVDELFYQDAANAGVLVAIEDGTDDGNEAIDSYLLPTWGEESVVDVLARYFPHTADENGTVIAIWTPEYGRSETPAWCAEPKAVGVGGQRTLWCKHTLSTADWWNVYTNGLGDGSEGFQDTPASPGAVALFRFNSDTDLDGYSDRSEDRLGTDPNDPSDFPQPELLAGLNSVRSGSYVTATLSLLNTGPYDAYGVEAVMVAPDDSVSITNNTVGGSGRVRAQKQVIVGSRIALQTPLPTAWTQASHAIPAAGGYYTGGEDRTYNFTVTCGNAGGCKVSSDQLLLGWSDSKGVTGTLSYGADYASPTFLPVGVYGLTLALHSGTVANGESFTVDARTPRDTFQYTINREPFTEPLIIVSYNDPQGNHRFILPPSAASLTTPSDNLASFGGQMLEDVGVEIVTTEGYAGGATSTSLLVNNPSETTLTDAHVFLEFINISGTVVSEVTTQVTLPPGPTTAALAWDAASFDPPYRADEDYIVMAFLTDYQGNILDTAGRPLSSFQDDPRPAALLDNSTQVWDFGTVQQGTLLEHPFALASVGYMDLLAYLGSAPGLSVEGPSATSISPGDIALYTVQLNTESLPMGAFETVIPLRTSDPQHPSASLTVVGTITPKTEDTLGGMVLRPLDTDVTIDGDHSAGEWITFTHTLGPDAQSLHPVKVYSQDYGVLDGVGKVASDLGQGVSSTGVFGTGADGDIVINSDVTFSPPRTPLGSSAGASQALVNLSNGSGFDPGSEVLLYQVRGVGAGNYEFARIVARSGNQITLDRTLKNTYTQGGQSKAQAIRVPNYQNVTVTAAGRWRAPAWNGNEGGVLVFRASGNLVVEAGGMIDSSGKGFLGTYHGPIYRNQTGVQGEGYTSSGAQTWSPNGNGGGGGQGTQDAGGGGGGGNGTSGGNGGVGQPNNRAGGAGGSSVGSLDLAQWFFGGAGGEGGSDEDGGNPGGGGNGGGIIAMFAKSVAVNGSVYSNGSNGGGACQGCGGGGGSGMGGGGAGAGGSIFIQGYDVSVPSPELRTNGGVGGPGNVGQGRGGSGGNGGQGRIRIEHCAAFSGSTNPSANIQKLNCFIAEQLDTAPYNTARLYLPESFTEGRTFNIQYGRRLSHVGSDTQTTTVSLPRQLYSTVTLDALVNNTGVASGPFALSLDFGGDGVFDWSHNATTASPATLNVTGTLSALNAYLVSRKDIAWGDSVDVPVGINLNRTADVILTNLALIPLSAKTRFVRLQARQYTTATLGLEFRQSGTPSSPLSFWVDIGANGTVDWSYNGNPTYPAHFSSPNLATAVNAYLATHSGEVDVPVRIVSNPFSDQSLIDDFDASFTDRPDLTLVGQNIGVSAARSANLTVIEGDTVPLSALIENGGSVDSGPVVVTFFATRSNPLATIYIGTALVPNVPKNGSAPAVIQWNTLGFSGDVTVRAVVDPFNRTAEGNEGNNSASTVILIRTRPDLQVTAVDLSDPLPMAGEMVTVTLTLKNMGQTTAGAQSIALFDANPESGGASVGSQELQSLAGESATIVSFQWTPPSPGPYRLFSLSDRDNAVNEFDEGNNRTWRDVYVGLAMPVLLDSGPGEPIFSPATGYGVVDEGQPDALTTCGSGVTTEETQRLDFDGRLLYRFDHLLPGRFYHLDVTLYECTGAGRQESIFIDGNLVDGPVNLGDGEVHRRSILIDPALYADHSVEVSIEVPGVNGAIISAINLHAVDYRYADSGGSNDPDYNAGLGYGALNGVRSKAWGTLPYQSVRVNQTGRSVDYRYDDLIPGQNYQLHLSFYQNGDNNRVEQVEIDGKLAGSEVTLVNGQKQRVSLAVPPDSYADDGSISISVVRTNADVGAIVNEIALEEQTIPTIGCSASSTPYWTQAYGSVTIAGESAPPGTIITAENPDGVIVGCFQVGLTGFYGFMPIFGGDKSSNPPIPGMVAGQQVKFRVDGSLAVVTPSLVWQNDKDIHRIDLTVTGIDSQWIRLNPGWTLFSLRVQPPVTSLDSVLNSIQGSYCQVHGEADVYDCALPSQSQGLRELRGSQAYYLRNESSATVNLLVQGAPVSPITPIPLHADWNWVGYLLQNSMPVADGLESIAGKYTRVADGKGRLYNPALPQFSTLTHLAPDSGYLIFATEAATLVYPQPVELAANRPVTVNEVCNDVSPTPHFTWLYGELLVNGQPAALGSRVDVLTPRGELAGCFVVDNAGQYGFVPIYGADGGNPPLPGFVNGEAMYLRVNGQEVTLAEPVYWRNDKQERQVNLSVEVSEQHIFLPLISR